MRFGIVGTNFISDEFVQGAKLLKEKIELTAVCSGKIENAKLFAEKHGIENVFSNHIEMLESGLIDAIYIATPNAMHYQMTMDGLNRKIPVFCEKPLAVTNKQAKNLIDTARENKTYLHHGIVPLYNPNFILLKEKLNDIGQIRRVVMSFSQYSSRYDRYKNGENPTTFRNALANGSFMDLGIYTVSLCVALFGKPKEVFANSIMLESNVDGATTAILVYEGYEAIVMVSKITNSNILSEISGEDGIISIEMPSRLKKIEVKYRGEDSSELVAETKDDLFRLELQEFIDVIESGKFESDKVPYDLSLDIIDTMVKARESSGIKYIEDEE